MNAETLIGTTLGTCILQKVIGQGGMGAVYLALQARPRRQVAVKVLMPPAPLSPHQRHAFLERFRRETDAAASLEHPNIVPVYEYGELNGSAFLVMPYISGGTLRDTIEIDERLPLPKVAHYLDQLAAALDFAHSRGVIHRDIKPANILVSPEGRLLLTDFGLVKIIADGQAPQVRLTGAGAPVGTPDYMSPEQVIGQPVDGSADQYSLGVIVYQMVTGMTPFQGETPMQIASQHLQTLPPAPRLMRPELPADAERVIKRALSKRPMDRFTCCQDFAEAFRAALAAAGYMVGQTGTGIVAAGPAPATAARLYTPRGLFDPSWQEPASPPHGVGNGLLSSTFAAQAASEASPPRPTGLLSRAGMSPRNGATGQFPAATATGQLPAMGIAQPPPSPMPMPGSLFLPKKTAALPAITGAQPAVPAPAPEMQQFSPALMPSPMGISTGTFPAPGYPEQGSTNTMKLTGPVKVVQMPVAGQPGYYMTGLLPVTPASSESGKLEEPRRGAPWRIIIISLLVALLLFGTAGSFWYARTHFAGTPRSGIAATQIPAAPNLNATATAAAKATATSNLILSDPLSQNINGWPISANEHFAGGAYHIYNGGNSAVAVDLPQQSFNMPNAFSLSMYEVRGNDTSNNNSFGMIFRFSQRTQGGKTVTTFYSFEVVNIAGGEYRFYKYDDSHGAGQAWTELWHQTFGHEYRQGQGAKNTNTFVIASNGPNFTFSVNGKAIGKAHDTSLAGGTIGMLVNLQGTEVAFSNLLVTRSQ